MGYIYQSGREALKMSVRKYAPMIAGEILDVGSSAFDRYGRLFKNATKYVRMDIDGVENVDVHGRAEELPVGDHSFNGIVCTQTLCDVYDVEKAVREFNRVLKKGGRVLSTTPFVSTMTDEPYYFWNMSPFALRKLYEDHGFKVLVLESTSGARETIFNLKTRFLIDNLRLYDHWYGRLFSYWFLVWTKWVRYRDRRDGKTFAQSRIAENFIVVAEKV